MIQALDFFPKSKSTQATSAGGLITILTLAAMLYYAYSETTRFLTPVRSLELATADRAEPFKMTLNLTVHSVPCHFLTVSVEDELLGHSLNINSITKTRLSKEKQVVQKNYDILRDKSKPKPTLMSEALEAGQGCWIYGTVMLKEVPGVFHISTKGQVPIPGNLMSQLRFSATIHKMAFGSERQIERLRQLMPGREFSVQDSRLQGRLVQIDLSLVKVEDFTSSVKRAVEHGYFVQQHQFSLEHETVAGLFFRLNIGEHTLALRSKQESLQEYLTWMLAVISGLFYFGLLVDRSLHAMMKCVL